MQKKPPFLDIRLSQSRQALSRLAGATELFAPWVKIGAVGIFLLLLVFVPGVDASPLDFLLRFLSVGLAAVVGAFFWSRREQSQPAPPHTQAAADRFLAVAKVCAQYDLGILLQKLAEELLSLVPCRGTCVVLPPHRQEDFDHIVTAGRFPKAQRGDLPVLLPKEVRQEAVERGVVVLNGAPAIHTRLRSLRVQEFAQKNLLIVALRAPQPEGFLILADKNGEADFHDNDVTLMVAIAEHAGLAIEKARRFADLRIARDKQHGLLHALITAQEQERKRVAEKWHERLGTKLFDILQSFRSCQTLITQRVPEARERFELLAADLDTVGALVRRFANELHPSVLDDFGFVAALREYVASLDEQEPFHVTVQAEAADQQLPSETHLTLFRITQEALCNIRQHAEARNVQIAFVQEHSGVSLMIKDDGRGFNPEHPPQGHFGLLYMRERAEACGGTFRVVSAHGQGTEVRVNFPSGHLPRPRSLHRLTSE
jgi:signal transduction histidine kinase